MSHVTEHFQDWIDDRLDEEARQRIDIHVADCETCRVYFERMAALLAKPESGDLPRLEPDPFLATRIRSLAEGPDAVGRGGRPGLANPARWLRLSYYGAMFVVAIVCGVYLGRGAAGREAAGTDPDPLITSYYEAFSQTGFAEGWDRLLETEDGNHKEL